MKFTKQFTRVLICLFLFSDVLHAQDISMDSMLQVIRYQGLENSQVMDHASWLMDVHGPRLTGSPKLKKAKGWAVDRLNSFGMTNARQDEWGPFGVSWELTHFEMHAYTPEYWPVLAYPKAWSPSTKGTVRGEVIFIQAQEEADLDKYRGKLNGKIVMLDTIREVKEWFDSPTKRYTSEELLDLSNAEKDAPRPRRQWQGGGGQSFNRTLWAFLETEKPAAVIERNYKGDLGTVFVTGARSGNSDKRAYDKDGVTLPQIVMAVEHYNRILRLLDKNIPVSLAFEIKCQTSSEPVMESNVLAEIPGTDKADEYVVFGAHIDSWHTGTGATDNGAGTAVMIEVARILTELIKTTGIQPRRTLQIGLWSGEEQGLFGSIAHVRKYYAETEPNSWTPKSLLPMQEKVSAYYNLDNGTGKVRGIWLQGNHAADEVFRPWLNAFKDLEANTLTLKNTGGTDHLGFDACGIPGFQFIQDAISYSTKTHHSNMDNYDHLVADDLKQAATIIAAIVWQTAMREEMIPRKPFSIDTSN